ncbi:MAG TPA: ATP-binding protein [Ilumatobacteraceae bacterium]|nr:ATP-binding protein [Ilumatobacteraceae bacterium]
MRDVLRRWNLVDGTNDTCELLVSELVSNAVLHGSGEVTVTVMECDDGGVRVEVRNQGSGRPVLRHPRPNDLSGRGLRLVDELSTRWGLDSRGGTTLVWFEAHLLPV